ncbi:Cdc15p [Rhizophagus irregularis DAOM 197198w]|uniref:Cdc15p n=1 Tax=Rhizophagus irregularis (strain DAOM 197198w) TaxID=1432141 RepID=A0A015LDG1_RHIIW|nr:Cdc15p [Rhizophagus irregularis DAOM 197198w]
MKETKLSDDVFEQIKDFVRWKLTEEQKSLLNKLILNEELKNCYLKYGLCEECKQPESYYDWCYYCKSKCFKQNFKNWTSGNHVVDKFIQVQLKAKNKTQVLEWIEYDRFGDIEYLAKGGFGTTFKTIWKDGYISDWNSNNNQWDRSGEENVALKCLHNSQDITTEFLREVESNILVSSVDGCIVRCFGITKEPKTNNFMMVMELKEGNLRQYLNDNFTLFNWEQKLLNIGRIANGLKEIHDKGLIHRDFHCGNILRDHHNEAFITDLGLCQPASTEPYQSDNKKIYGVLPYVAPEVLRRKEYTQASDIYGFGIIAYEICTGLPPYHDIAHDEFLAMKVCQGLRPKVNYKIPQIIFDIINKCWNAEPSKRPEIKELYKLLWDINLVDVIKEDSIIYKQIKEAEEINKKLPSTVQSSSLSTSNFSYTTHPKAVYTSRLLDFKNLPEPKNANIDYSSNSFETEYSESIRMDFTKLDINSKGD